MARAVLVGLLAALAWLRAGEPATHVVPPGRITAARQLLQELEKQAAGLPPGSEHTIRRLTIASFRARSGDVEAGLHALASVTPPYDFSMREIVQDMAAAQALRGDVAGALKHVTGLSRDLDADTAIVGVAAALARAGRQGDALSVVGRARDAGGRDRIVAAIVIGLLEADDRRAALAALGAVPGPLGPSPRMLEAYLHARDGNLAEARRVGAGAADDTWLFGFVQRAHAQARGGDVAGALATVGHIPPGDMRTSGQGAVASGQARGGDVAGALVTAGHLPETARNLAYTDITIVQAHRGDVTGALQTAGLIQIPGNQAHALAEVARASARGGDVTGALRIARSLSFVEYRRTALKAVVEARAELGDTAGALAMISTLTPEERRGLELAVALARARAGDPSLVLKLFTAPVAGFPADVVLLQIVAYLLRLPAEDPTTSPFWTLDFHPFR